MLGRKPIPKTLRDYIYKGKHELVAFVRDERDIDIHDENSTTQGNKLGIGRLGILVCDRKPESKEEQAYFLYKDKPRTKTDSDIARAYISYEYSTVVNEFPLAISSKQLFGWHFGKNTETYKEAKRVLSEHGLY